eukprot:scaffold16870_cov64-Cylindrotheca_fusiformis.AAC.1
MVKLVAVRNYRNSAQRPAYLYDNRSLRIVQVHLALWVELKNNFRHRVDDFFSGDVVAYSPLGCNCK